MNEKYKGKYAFILTFYMGFGNSKNVYQNASIFSDKEELCYIDIKNAEKDIVDNWELQSGYCVNSIVLLNCIRTIAYESE